MMISLSIISGTNNDLPKVSTGLGILSDSTRTAVVFLFLAPSDTHGPTVGVHISI
jgi:hypothetical protein